MCLRKKRMPEGARACVSFQIVFIPLRPRNSEAKLADSSLRCSGGLLITVKTLIGQLYIPQAVSLVAANPLKQQMSWSSSFAVNPELRDKCTISKKSHTPLYVYLPTNGTQLPQWKWVVDTAITSKSAPIYYKIMTRHPQKGTINCLQDDIDPWPRAVYRVPLNQHWDFELHSEGNVTLPTTHLSWWQSPISFPLHRRHLPARSLSHNFFNLDVARR